MAELRVRVELPDLGPDDGRGTVRVVLRDTSMADGLDPTIAEAASAVPAGGDAVDLVLDVPAEAVDPRHRYSLWAHVDRAGDGALASGDLITTVNVPVTADDIAAGRSYDVPVVRI